MYSFLSASSIFNSLIAIIFLIIIPLQADYRVDERDYSLIKPYSSGRSFHFLWEYSGNVFITNEFIRLTPDETSKSGRLWSKKPNPLKNWEAIVQFQVEGKGTTLFGDGMVFWYTKDRMTTGPVFGSKNNFSGLAVFLDTYSNHNGPHNHEHPYISAMISNGSLAYDHDRDGTHTQLAGCEAKFRKLTHDTFLAVKYENYVLSVSIDIENTNNWKTCFVVKGVRLPTNYYFGFSAATGDLSDTHKIISFRLYNIPTNDPSDFSNIAPSAEYFEVPRARIDDIKSSRWSLSRIFLTFVVVAIVLIAAAFAAVYYYQTKNERNMKRLY